MKGRPTLKRIYLLGYMGSGKSTLGNRLAKSIGYDFIDTDQTFEQKHQIDLEKYFRIYGEKKFRMLEQEVLHETFQLDRAIISTGGGTPCFKDNMQQIKANGFSVYLRMPAEALYQRLIQTKRIRPLTAGLKDQELLDFIHKTLEKRDLYYEQADLCISGINLKPKDLITVLSYYNELK